MSRNVLHLIDTGGPGGAETIFLNLVTGLDEDRWRSIAAVPIRDWLHGALVREGVEPMLLPSKGSFDLGYLGRICGLVRRHRVDLIQTHLLTTAVYGSLAGFLTRVPVICTFHGQADVHPGESHLELKLRILGRHPNRMVFVSEALRRSISALGRLDERRMHVVHNGIDVSVFTPAKDRSLRAEFGIPGDEILIGAVGNIRASKDYSTFLRAAARLRERSRRYRFLIVGHGEGELHDDVLRLRTELGLEETVILAGFREDIPRVMHSLDLYLISSSAEGFSLSTVQALASGVPVVATRCGGPEEILRDGVHGVLVDPRSPEKIAEAVHALASDPERCARFSRAGRKFAQERFSTLAMVRGYERVYQALLGVAVAPRGVDRAHEGTGTAA